MRVVLNFVKEEIDVTNAYHKSKRKKQIWKRQKRIQKKDERIIRIINKNKKGLIQGK